MGYINDNENYIAYVSSIGVKKRYRENGVAQSLINHFTNLAINNNMSYMSLYTHKDNDAAIKFYKKNNFKVSIDPENREDSLCFKKKI